MTCAACSSSNSWRHWSTEASYNTWKWSSARIFRYRCRLGLGRAGQAVSSTGSHSTYTSGIRLCKQEVTHDDQVQHVQLPQYRKQDVGRQVEEWVLLARGRQGRFLQRYTYSYCLVIQWLVVRWHWVQPHQLSGAGDAHVQQIRGWVRYHWLQLDWQFVLHSHTQANISIPIIYYI